MNRRRAMVAIGMAAARGAAGHSNAEDDGLRADLSSMGSRVYSEEGVPMFLACENLSGSGSAAAEAPISSALNRKVVSAFRRYADEWQQMRPDAPASDVAKILELLADRDFASGGTEVRL